MFDVRSESRSWNPRIFKAPRRFRLAIATHALFSKWTGKKATTAPVAPPTEPPTLAVREKEPKRQEKRDRQGERDSGTFVAGDSRDSRSQHALLFSCFFFFWFLQLLVALLGVLLQYKPPPYPVVSPLSSFSLRAFLQNHEKQNAFVSFRPTETAKPNQRRRSHRCSRSHLPPRRRRRLWHQSPLPRRGP